MSKIVKDVTKLALENIPLIAELARLGGEKGEHAATVLELIATIAEAIQKGIAREVDPKEIQATIEAGLDAFQRQLDSNRKHARDIVDKRFPVVPVQGDTAGVVTVVPGHEAHLQPHVNLEIDTSPVAETTVETVDDKFPAGE